MRAQSRHGKRYAGWGSRWDERPLSTFGTRRANGFRYLPDTSAAPTEGPVEPALLQQSPG